jgi:hypothetical protein
MPGSLVLSKGAKLLAGSALSATLGLTAIVVGGVYYPTTVNGVLDTEVKDTVIINEPSKQARVDGNSEYTRWTRTESFGGKVGDADHPAQYSFYLFNITNPKATLWGHSPPVVQQIGPYVYDIFSRKFDVIFSANQQVSYKVHEWIKYRQEHSVGDATIDLVTTANIPYARLLVNLEKANQTETFLAGRFAFEALTDYQTHLVGPFLAEAKRSALSRYLSKIYRELRTAEVPRALGTEYPKVLTASIPETLMAVNSNLRTAYVPAVLARVSYELNVVGIWSTLDKYYQQIRINSGPRVLTGLYSRLTRVGIPAGLQHMMHKKKYYEVPRKLKQIYGDVSASKTPARLRKVLRDVCNDAIPTVLDNIRTNLVQKRTYII